MATRIYTRTGDQGDTALWGGPRVKKSHPRVSAYGDVDELGACLGVALSHNLEAPLKNIVTRVCHRLFDLGACLADPKAIDKNDPKVEKLWQDAATELERGIDKMEQELPALHAFVLCGGSPSGAALHLSRVVCRRAERSVVALVESQETIPSWVLPYLNRLSDFLFVAARHANQAAGVPDCIWQPASAS